ncbi:MAG TPA: helix-turn-helix domain-containing protein [Bacteroidales bacterium]|nr:helix-turn-helix domain-containing protein [Bacteroidales bacterium]
MIREILTITLGLSFFFPFVWALTYILSRQYKQKSKLYLVLLLIASSFVYMMTYFKFMNHIDAYTFLFPLQTGVVLTLFPLLYLYIKSMTSSYKITKLFILKNLSFPIFIFVIFLTLQKFMIKSENEEQFVRFLLDQNVAQKDYFHLGKMIYFIGKIILVITSLVYTIFIIKTLKKYYLEIKELLSENDNNELKWLKGLGYAFILIVFFFAIIHILTNKQVMENSVLVIISYLMFAGFFWYVGLNGFRQKEVFEFKENNEPDFSTDAVKISKKQLSEYLEKTKPFKDSNITAFDFCYHFHTNRTYLSDSIRKNFNQNFRGLINVYRVREAKKLMEESLIHKGFIDLDYIAKESGFSSYTTFFRVFKNETGLNPSDFSNQLTNAK